MPRVRYLDTSTYSIRDGPTFSAVGDEADVAERTADRLTKRPDFERVESERGDGGSGGQSEDFGVDRWLDHSYQDRAEAVREGSVDTHLDVIADAETSQTVLDAIGDRRRELGGE